MKRYQGGRVLELPAGWTESSTTMAATLAGGRPDRRPIDLDELARSLFLTGGVTRRIQRGGEVRRFRAAPSAGALYPTEIYVVSGGLRDLPDGVHHHDPVGRTLRQLRRGDLRGYLARAVADPAVAHSPISFVFTGIPWRTTWKYGPRGYRHLFWDAGAMIANTIVATASVGWPTSVHTGFVDRMVSDLVALGDQPLRELPLAVVHLRPDEDTPHGHEPSDPPAAPELPPVDLRVEPLSPETRRYDEIASVHTVTGFAAEDDVIAWRAGQDAGSFPRSCRPGEPPDATEGSVDEVVLRRGSTRRFDPDAVVPGEHVRWASSVALADVRGDLAPTGRLPIDAAATAHAAEEVPPGRYRLRCDGWDRIGDQDRRRTAHQCLDQSLGGTSTVTVFWGCDLGRLLDAAGPRSYRAAELAAGIAGERLQLAAFALGLGATGLTFYDDEVRDATGLDPLLVTAIGRPDYRPTPGHRPGSEDR